MQMESCQGMQYYQRHPCAQMRSSVTSMQNTHTRDGAVYSCASVHMFRERAGRQCSFLVLVASFSPSAALLSIVK